MLTNKAVKAADTGLPAECTRKTTSADGIIINTTLKIHESRINTVVSGKTDIQTNIRKPVRKSNRKYKILQGHSTNITSTRQTVTKYTTNNEQRAAAAFYYLKSLTTSGTVHGLAQLLPSMAAEFKKSVPTVRTWLRHAQASGYLTISGNNIYLASYEKVCEVHGLQAAFHTIECEASALPMVFYALEIAENQARQDHAFMKRLQNNQALAGLLTELLNCDVEQLRPALLSAQIAGFVRRSESSQYIYAINADTGRNEARMQKTWQYRSKASVYDVKRALITAGLVTVERRTYSSSAASYCKKRFTSYEQSTGKRTTWLPDQITLNPRLFRV